MFGLYWHSRSRNISSYSMPYFYSQSYRILSKNADKTPDHKKGKFPLMRSFPVLTSNFYPTKRYLPLDILPRYYPTYYCYPRKAHGYMSLTLVCLFRLSAKTDCVRVGWLTIVEQVLEVAGGSLSNSWALLISHCSRSLCIYLSIDPMSNIN